jgi:trigger factor
MKVTQEKLPQSQVQLEIEVPGEKSQQIHEKVVKSLIQNVKLPGFRQGKIPQKILLQRLGESKIKANTLEQLLQDSLRDAMLQEKLVPIGEYELISTMDELLASFTPGQPLVFKVKFDVPPEVTIAEYKGLKIKVEELIVEDSDVDEFLEEKRREHAPLVPVEDRAVQMGDVVIIDYIGYLEGETEPLPGGEAQDFQLEMEDGKFIDEFIAGIVGMATGATKEFPVNFPEDYPREDLAGQTANFTITLKEIKAKELPELDDDFAQDFSEYETIAELRDRVKEKYEAQALKDMETAKQQAMLKEIAGIVTVDLPESMILDETNMLLNRAISQLSQMGMDARTFMNDEILAQMRQRSRPDAITNLKQTLGLIEVAQQESLIPTEAEISEVVKEYASQMKGQKINMQRLQQFVQEDLTKDKALKWLVEQAEIELVPEGTLDPDTIEEDLPEDVLELAEVMAAADVDDKQIAAQVAAVEE